MNCHCWCTNEIHDASNQKVRPWAGAKYGVAVNFFTTMLDRSRLRCMIKQRIALVVNRKVPQNNDQGTSSKVLAMGPKKPSWVL